MAGYEINCTCCRFSRIQNCKHPLRPPFTFIAEDEPLVNHQRLEVDIKEYDLFRHLMFHAENIHLLRSDRHIKPRVFLGNQILPLPDWYLYPVAYAVDNHGVRRITVSFIDRVNQQYLQCDYDFDIFPHRLYRTGFQYRPRVAFCIRNFTQRSGERDVNRAPVTRSFVLGKGDWIVQKLVTNDPCEAVRVQLLKETGVLVSRRLVQLLRYVNILKTRVRAHVLNNCLCGCIAKGMCRCVEMCERARYIYDTHSVV